MATRVLGPLMLTVFAGSANAWSTSTLQCTDSACTQGCVEVRSEQGDDQCHQSSASEFWKGSCNSKQVVQKSGCKSGCVKCERTFTLPVGKCNSIGGGKYTTTKCSQNSAEMVDANVTVAAEAQAVSIPTKPLMLAGSANAWSTSTLQCTDSACEQGCVEVRSEQGDDQCHQSSASEFWKGSCNSKQVVQKSGCKSGCVKCGRTFTLPVGKCNSIGGGKYTTTKCSQNSAEVVDGNVTVAAEAQRVSIPTKRIASGVNMPVISIGTGGEERSQATVITSTWLKQGGRGIDTAYNYGDQKKVGNAIIKSGVSRKSLFITTKMPGCKDADFYVKTNLKELQVDYIDLMLIHGPSGTDSDCQSTWKTLEKYHKQGVLKSIGISNFNRRHISSLMKTAKVVPHVNQIKLNVLTHNNDDIAASVERGMKVMAYSPLGRAGHAGDISGHPTIKSIAAAHKVSTYQVAIKWILQKGYLLTFQSSSSSHQASNANVFGFTLGKAEMKKLDALKSAVDVVV